MTTIKATIKARFQYWYEPAEAYPFKGRLTVLLPAFPSGSLVPELQGREHVLGEQLGPYWGYPVPAETNTETIEFRYKAREVQGPSWEAVRVAMKDLLAAELETLRRVTSRQVSVPPSEEVEIQL